MEVNLQHEDLLIQLRAILNDEKIKLWEPPYYVQPGDEVSPSLQDLAKKYAATLSTPHDVVLKALHELQLHSVDRSKANAEFKETGFATFRVKATLPGQKPQVLKIQKKLDSMGSDLIATVATEINVSESRVKLIVNGKVIKPTSSLEEQGVKNGAQIMALVIAESPEEVRKEHNMYMEMKSTRDDALLLTECVDDFDEDEEYIKLEDQSGKAVELPPAERRSLMVGLALHERGRQAAKKHDYPLALVLYLEADCQFNACRSALLSLVDNWALLQLDIAWCYLCLQNLSLANDAAARLARAEESFRNSYGENHERLIALKGTAANERVLIMRLHLLQGIVAYHQNQRAEARRLLERAERDLNALRVDDNLVIQLVELGWSEGAARRGLRASCGDVNEAHHYLTDRRAEKQRTRSAQRAERQKRLLGLCEDGSPVSQKLVEGLVAMGFSRSLAIVALRNSNNHAAEAVRLIQEQPEMLEESDMSSVESETPSSEDSAIEPDNRLVAELEAMGYCPEEARTALRVSKNKINDAIEMLIPGAKRVEGDESSGNPSTSAGFVSRRPRKQKTKKISKRKERQMALNRLSAAIRHEEDDHLDTSLVEEEEFLVRYKSLL